MRQRAGVVAGIVAVFTAPLTILAHECARAMMILLVGGTPHIRFVWVAFDIPNTGPATWTPFLTFLITVAGPVFTLLTAALAVLWLRLGYTPVVWALVLSAPLRAIMELGHALQWWQLGGVGTSRLLTDETRMEIYLNLPPGTLVAANLLLSFACALIAIRLLPGRERRSLVMGGVLGTITGAALWLLLVGPLLLPG